MNENKLVKGIICGAIIGGAVTMFDRKTRDSVMNKTRYVRNEVVYYNKNRNELKSALDEKVTKWKSIYNQLASDVLYVSNKVNEVKGMTPQVKNLLNETKDTFTQSKEEYKAFVTPEQEPSSIFESVPNK